MEEKHDGHAWYKVKTTNIKNDFNLNFWKVFAHYVDIYTYMDVTMVVFLVFLKYKKFFFKNSLK